MAVHDPNQPFNDIPLLPFTVKLETEAILKLCIESRVRLEQLRQLGQRVPNQAVLIHMLSILEAEASSAIENIVTTAYKLFQFATVSDRLADPATKEALRYRTALRRGFELLRAYPVSTRVAVEVCRTLRNVEVDVRKVPSTALVNNKTGNTVYAPPVGEDLIRRLLANWERFLHTQNTLDPLVRMAVGHYQFEAIHPFSDGNGRTGRILNLLYLCDRRLLDQPVLYLSRYILQNRSDYYRLLRSVTNSSSWVEWIEYMLEGVRTQAVDTVNKVKAILRMQSETAEFVKQRLPRIYTHELVELLFVQPYCRIKNLVEADLCQRQTASFYLRSLSEHGVLAELAFGREKLFVNSRYLQVLSSYENRFTPCYAESCVDLAIMLQLSLASRI